MTIEEELEQLAIREAQVEAMWAEREAEREAAKLLPTVFGSPAAIVRDHAVSYKGSPVSRSLPRRNTKEGKADVLSGRDVLSYSDGSFTTRAGQPIVLNRRDSDNARDRTGMSRE